MLTVGAPSETAPSFTILRPSLADHLPSPGPETAIDPTFVATVKARHDDRPYVLLEQIEEMLADVQCAHQIPWTTTRITIRFHDQAFFAAARDAWAPHDQLSLITHHPSCNDDFDERAVYV